MPAESRPPCTTRGLDRLLAPRSVAVIGASNDPTRIGGRPIAYMRAQGFPGMILPINPNRSEVQGLKAYAKIAELPEVPDVAIVAVPAAQVVAAVEELGERGTQAAIIFSSGFAEQDQAGAGLQARLTASARARGIRLIGPNSLGLFNAHSRFYGIFTASFESGYPAVGRIGIVSQSGAYGTHLLTVARDRGLGVSACIATGNEADVTVGELIGWMAQDANTDVIAAYAEGIRDAALLLDGLAAARAAKKPVVMMKVGSSTLGRVAAQSHTAAIAGDDAVIDAVLREFGVVRTRSCEAMLDIAKLATRRVYPVGNTLGCLTVSGGAGVLVSDIAESVGLAMPPMPEAAQRRLRGLLPYAAPRNPLDCTAQVLNQPELVGQFAQSMVQEGGYRSILAFFSQTGAARSFAPHLRRQLQAVRERHPERLYVLSVLASPAQIAEYEADGLSVFEDPNRAVVAIEAMGRFGEAFARGPCPPAPNVPAIALPEATPSEAEAKRILATAGITAVPERACSSATEAAAAAAAIGYPVVMKILSPDIAHKSEIGGVLLDIGDAAGARAGFATLLGRAKAARPDANIEGVLVAKQLRGGVECILGSHRDPVFGPIAMFGLGGIFVEVLKDVAFHRCPFGPEVAMAMIMSIKAAPLLQGARGRPKADLEALATMLARLSAVAHAAGPRLRAIDLNPVFAMPEGQGAFAADAALDIED